MDQKSFAFKSLSLVLILGLLAFQIPLYAVNEIEQNPAGIYTPVKSASEVSTEATDTPTSVPHSTGFGDEGPLSPSTSDEPIASAASVLPTTPLAGSIVINSGETYTANPEVTLHLEASGGAIQGDYNQNGEVDAGDYVVWRDQFGWQANTPDEMNSSDGDLDGDVDGADFMIWQSHFGNTNGITEMGFSQNGTDFTWENYDTSKTFTLSGNDGQKTVYVKFRDFFGNKSIVYSEKITLDTTPPTGSVVINNNAAHTNTPNVTLTLTADDTISGVHQMRFKVGDENWTDWEDFASTKQLTLPNGTGSKTVQYELKDHAGNISNPYSDDIVLDVHPPPVLPNQNIVVDQDMSVTFELGPLADEDGDSLVYSYETSAPAFSSQFQVVDANHLLYTPSAGFVGYGGNLVTWAMDGFETSDFAFISFNVKDTTVPTGSIVINNGNAHTNSATVTLTLTAVDNSNLLTQMRFKVGDADWTDWENSAPTKQLPLPGPNGTKNVQYEIQDQTGNISSIYSDDIILDVLPVLQNQNLSTNQDVQKTFLLGPLTDADGDHLTYSYFTSATGAAEIHLLDNQITYIPAPGYIGVGGVISVQASDGLETTNFSNIILTVKAPVISSSNDPYAYKFYNYNLPANQAIYKADVTNAARAFNLAAGVGIGVAIIDTGIEMVHPDLDANIFTNPGEISGDGIDNDANGFVDDIHGWDFVNGDNNPSDDEGHGTSVAGIVAGERNNNEGIVGIAPSAKVVPIKVLDANGSGSFQNIINGIYYAILIGAKVINMSLGALFDVPVATITTGDVQSLHQAIAAAVSADIIVVVAAGNGDSNNVAQDIEREAPAAFDNVISVGATSSSDVRASFSNFGDELDVMAPGLYVIAPSPTWDTPAGYRPYSSFSGTSAASPFVAGLAALIKSQAPTSTEADVLRRLKYSSKDLGTPGFDPLYGFGRVDAFKALTYDYYDNGSIKTEWLEQPDENGKTRLDFDSTGHLIVSGAGAGSVSGFSGLGASIANAVINSTIRFETPAFSPTPLFQATVILKQHAPLIWNAFESHYSHKAVSEEEKDSDLLPYLREIKNRHLKKPNRI